MHRDMSGSARLAAVLAWANNDAMILLIDGRAVVESAEKSVQALDRMQMCQNGISVSTPEYLA